MGKIESEIIPPMADRQAARSKLRIALQLVVAGVLVTSIVRWYLGGPIQMVPGKDGLPSSETELLLRDIYVQSTPKPPASLVALSVQGTQAGKAALKQWYNEQASMARERGYMFPFRMSRWSRQKGDMGIRSHPGQLTAHKLTFSHGGKEGQNGAIAAAEVGSAGSVAAGGTSRMLHGLRNQYLSSTHGQRHSYWTEATANGTGKWAYYIDDGLRVPNITHKATLVQLARMAANAYQPTDSETWEQLGDRWDTHNSFGWADDGVRGHVFADATNTTVVLSLKGTSSTFFLGGGSETSARDKFNDNRLFSCCCAYVDFTWSTVCDCHMSGSKCDAVCLRDALNDEAADNYFFAAAQIFMDVVARYPDATIVLTGHSLGGALAALLGLTFGLPAIGFEAPGDRLAAERLHLPLPPAAAQDNLPLFHVGHTADPVFMGVCSGRTSSCYYAGYAMESRCHNGRQLVFDTVARRDWRVDIRHHRINEVVYLVLEPWGITDPEEPFPELELEDPACVDCGLWKFIDENSPQ
ncbi:putative lipase atg15 [Coemansia sp. RSA 1290]|nr:putative lipase atg15 [Coemansia sp. RSA 1290]KAJ2646196.1 putative lipase atg15 [Coemansia sp. RSA 1250]